MAPASGYIELHTHSAYSFLDGASLPEELAIRAVELAEDRGEQLELLRSEGEARKGRLQQGLRQVRAAVGSGGISMVVEVAPWSRIPEARTLLVPRDD